MSGYSEGGASHSKKVLKSWLPNHFSAKSDIDLNLKTLRDRASDLFLNSAVGHAAIKTSTIGAISSGLKLFPRIKAAELGLTAEEARRWCRKTKLEFELWTKSLHCDFYRRNNFQELQQIAYSSYLMDGDSFCLFRRRQPSNENPYSLRLQLIEAGRVSNPNSGRTYGVEMRGKTVGSRIINGIEINREGRLEAVWISNRIVGEQSINPELEWQRVKVFGSNGRNVLHICKDSRIEQNRGEPYLSPVIETLKQLDRYSSAELASAVLKAFFSLFFTQSLQSLDINQIAGDSGEPCLNVDDYRVESGTILALPRGVDVKAIDNTNAQSTFDAFTTQFLTQIGSALSIPAEVLLKSYKNSYSASRAALMQANDEFRQRRLAFVNDFCAPVYETFLAEAIALGRIEAPGFFEDPVKKMLWSKAEWYVEGTHMLDVTKEIEGAERRIALGISSREKEAAELCGVDFYENLSQLQEEKELMENL